MGLLLAVILWCDLERPQKKRTLGRPQSILRLREGTIDTRAFPSALAIGDISGEKNEKVEGGLGPSP